MQFVTGRRAIIACVFTFLGRPWHMSFFGFGFGLLWLWHSGGTGSRKDSYVGEEIEPPSRISVGSLCGLGSHMASVPFVVIYFPRHTFTGAYVSKLHLCKKEGKNFGLMHKSAVRLRKNYKTFCYMFQSHPGANLQACFGICTTFPLFILLAI